jgi:hypothetical protein
MKTNTTPTKLELIEPNEITACIFTRLVPWRGGRRGHTPRAHGLKGRQFLKKIYMINKIGGDYFLNLPWASNLNGTALCILINRYV